MTAAVASFVERLPELTAKGDRHRTKTHRHWWAPCDVCGEGMWVETSRFDLTKTDREDGKPPGLSCRMTAGCEGRHRKPSPNPEETSRG